MTLYALAPQGNKYRYMQDTSLLEGEHTPQLKVSIKTALRNHFYGGLLFCLIVFLSHGWNFGFFNIPGNKERGYCANQNYEDTHSHSSIQAMGKLSFKEVHQLGNRRRRQIGRDIQSTIT